MDATGQRTPNRMKRELAAGNVCLGATITIYSPAIAELLSRVGLDWLWIDTEHTALSLEEVSVIHQATNGTEVSAVIRVPWNNKPLIKRPTDPVPDGTLVRMTNTAADAEASVRAMKYPP